nr:MAG TPA: hypothetical protein [Caudoviricetes sp.]
MSRIASRHILNQLIHVLQFLGVLCGFFAHSAADAVTDENAEQAGLGRNAVGNQTVVVNQTAMVNVPAGTVIALAKRAAHDRTNFKSFHSNVISFLGVVQMYGCTHKIAICFLYINYFFFLSLTNNKYQFLSVQVYKSYCYRLFRAFYLYCYPYEVSYPASEM